MNSLETKQQQQEKQEKQICNVLVWFQISVYYSIIMYILHGQDSFSEVQSATNDEKRPNLHLYRIPH